MKARVLLVSLLFVRSAYGAAPEQGAPKLRSLAVLPTMHLHLVTQVSCVEHPDEDWSKAETSRRISSLQAELKQDPTDGVQWLRLSDYLLKADRRAEYQAALDEATKHLRRRAEGRPQDGAAQALFATALVNDGKLSDAERLLRATIKSIPKDWTCWAGLGDLLDTKFFASLGWSMARVKRTSFDKELKVFGSKKATAAQIKEAEDCQDEADLCFSQAIKLAPRHPQALLVRANHVSEATTRMMAKNAAMHQPLDKEEVFRSWGSSANCSAWAEAVKVNPTNYAAIGYWGWTEVAQGLFRQTDGTKPIERISETRRTNLLEAMRLLETGSRDPNPKLAAEAFENLGVLRFLATLETTAAKAAFRQAVALDPTRCRSWEGLVCATVGTEGNPNPQDVVSVCEERLRYDDNARNRAFLIRAYDRAGMADKALAQARSTFALEPTNALSHLCLGALLLRRAEDPKAIGECKEHMKPVVVFVVQTDDEDEGGPIAVACGLDLAIIFALEGDTDKAEKTLRDTCKLDAAEEKDKARAKEIEAAMGK
ncbi:MAG: hypothetical protein C5B50_26000 [Verrucomicrobia bacterium]|nr:MAG: hypothetical protein C5B50_26000 [Verrucomicrobiota bacterium]